MADPDEKDEIDDVKTPGDGLGHPGDPKAVVDLSDIDIPGVQDDDHPGYAERPIPLAE